VEENVFAFWVVCLFITLGSVAFSFVSPGSGCFLRASHPEMTINPIKPYSCLQSLLEISHRRSNVLCYVYESR
jgi:hypothetical protein